MTEHKSPLTPVMGASGCLGHVLLTAKGYRAFNASDQPLGTFASAGDAAAAILTAGST